MMKDVIINVVLLILFTTLLSIWFIKDLRCYLKNNLENNYETIIEKGFDIFQLIFHALFIITGIGEAIIIFFNDIYQIDYVVVNTAVSVNHHICGIFAILKTIDYVWNKVRKMKQ